MHVCCEETLIDGVYPTCTLHPDQHMHVLAIPLPLSPTFPAQPLIFFTIRVLGMCH